MKSKELTIRGFKNWIMREYRVETLFDLRNLVFMLMKIEYAGYYFDNKTSINEFRKILLIVKKGEGVNSFGEEVVTNLNNSIEDFIKYRKGLTIENVLKKDTVKRRI